MIKLERQVFENFDMAEFWGCASSEPPSEELIKSIEKELGYKLPAAYVKLMQYQNGGDPVKNIFPRPNFPKDQHDYYDIATIFGIGRDKLYSLCGKMGSAFWMAEWKFPAIGVYIGATSSGGHEMICLDYRECGKEGEPQVVHIDQEGDFQISIIAPNFENFIRGLVPYPEEIN